MSQHIIKIDNMNKWFGDFQVLKDINLEVEKNKKNRSMWTFRIWKINLNKMY